MASMIKKTVLSLIIISCVLLLAGGLFYRHMVAYTRTPTDPSAGVQTFTVKPGQGFSAIATQLENQKLITSSRFFRLFVRLQNADKKLQAGEYRLSAAQAPQDILNMLVSGKINLYKITIPEGFNIKEIALLTAKTFQCRSEEFSRLCQDLDFIASLEIKAASLEGYLFPDTYFFPAGTDCRKVISTMVKRFHEIFKKEWQHQADKMGLSRHDIVTLASIIEKETGAPQERPLISSVFHNRLKRKMRLESDPTVIYGIKNFDGNIKRKHLKMITPYNTYQIKGLPVGPIASPGAKSLEAALFPVDSEYLFFVSKKDTTHHFSKNFDEHNRAVRKYQLGKK